MRAAQISEVGREPEPAELDGSGEIEIVAVALNPLDLAIGAGRFYGGHPPLPYVPGCEAVGRLDGERVYLFGDGRGIRRRDFSSNAPTFRASSPCRSPGISTTRSPLPRGSPESRAGFRSPSARPFVRTIAS